MNLKKATALLLVAAMALPAALTGCGKKNEPVKSKPTNVYKVSDYTLEGVKSETDRGGSYLSGTTLQGSTVYYGVNNYNYSDEESTNTYTLYTLNTDSGEVKQVFSADTSNANFGNMVPTPNGNVWFTQNSWGFDEETQEYKSSSLLLQYSADGELVKTVDLNELFPDADGIYLNNPVTDADGNLYFANQSTLYELDANGEVVASCELELDYVNRFLMLKGKYYVIYYSDTSNSQVVQEVSFPDGTLGQTLSFEGNVSNYVYSMKEAPDSSAYDFYYNDGFSLCGYSLAAKTSTPLCNWINSDINGSSINSFFPLDDETFICQYSDEAYDHTPKIAKLTHIPDDEVVEKYILTLAGLYLDWNVTNYVLKFNRSNEEYRITLKDYSTYNTDGNSDNGLTQFNNDLIAGNIPDIIFLTDELPLDSYASKGLFADLYPFLDSDTELNREDFLQNILDAFSMNGKLYQLVPAFTVMTLVGKTANIGKSGYAWTVDDLISMTERFPEAAIFRDFNQSSMVNQLTSILIDEFIDKETGKCSFNSDTFIKYLNLLTMLSDKSIWDDYDWENDDGTFWNDYETGFRNNKFLLENYTLSSFSNYWYTMKGEFGEQISLIGYPTSSNCGSVISPNMRLAMSAKTKMPEGAWQFMRFFWTDEYQLGDNMWGFSPKLSVLKKQAEEAQKPYEWTDDNGEVHVEHSTYWLNNESIEIGEIDDASVEEIMNFLKSLHMVQSYNKDIQSIMTEELDQFLNGAQSAEKTAEVIQNRVSTKVSESR